MNTIIPPVSPQDMEAAEWCLSLAEGELSATDRADFDQWIADDANAAALEHAACVWSAAGQAAGLPDIVRLRSEALERLRAAQRAHGRRSLSWGWAPRAAAAMAGALIFGMLFLQSPAKVYRTDVGERQVARLADGSRLSLDADTEVRVTLSRNRRDLVLTRGRAKFDVASDPLRPFAVRVDGKMVVATGTSFSVERLDLETRVLLYEGRVAVMDAPAGSGGSGPTTAQALTLEPGTGVVAARHKPLGEPRVFSFDLTESLGWEAGRLNLDDEPLALAVARINRYSTRKVVVADPVLNRLPVNGVFAAGDVEAFLEAVTAFHEVQAVERDGVVTLRPP